MDENSSKKEETKVLKIVANMEKNLSQRLATLEDRMNNQNSSEKTSSEESPETSGNTSENAAELQDKIAYLSSDEYKDEVVKKWLTGLDSVSFAAIGVKLGFLEDSTFEDPGEKAPADFVLEDSGQKVQFTHKKPDDITGWVYSEALNMYAKVMDE